MQARIITICICLISLQGFCQKKIAFQPLPVYFNIRNAGINVRGSISGLEAFVTVDQQNKNIVKIEGTLDPNTILTGITLRDNHLKKADYFDVKQFPKILISSTALKKIRENKYVGSFNVTIKDVTKNITTPFIFSAVGNLYLLTGEFVINRLDFNLGEESTILSNQVKIKMELKTNQE